MLIVFPISRDNALCHRIHFHPKYTPTHPGTSFKGGVGGSFLVIHPHAAGAARSLIFPSAMPKTASVVPPPRPSVGWRNRRPSSRASLPPVVSSPVRPFPRLRERKRNGGEKLLFPFRLPPLDSLSVPTVRTHARYTQGNSRRRQLRGNGI